MQVNPLSIHHGKFSVLDATLKELPIVGFDTEDDTKGTPLSFAFYSDQGHFYTHKVNEALDYVYDAPETTVFAAHQLEYDLNNLFKACNWKYVEEMTYASRLLKATLYFSRNYFINSMNFFNGSLEKMGKFVGLSKLEGNVFDPKYNIRDAQIVYVFIKRFQKKLIKELGVNLGITIGQIAISAYRRNFMLNREQTTYNSRNCLRAYYGGRVEIFYMGNRKGPIHVADINSAYPTVMRNFPYPDTTYIEPSSIGTHEFGIGKFQVRVPRKCFVPPLPVHSKDGRLFFPTGKITGWWTYAEVRYAQTCGVKILKEFEGEGTNRGCMPFGDFVNYFYDRRMPFKKRLKKNENDYKASFESWLNKWIPNNLYGKFCQHKAGTIMTREPLFEHKLKDKVYKMFKIGPFYNYNIEKTIAPFTANFMWGIYVTSYARIYLHKALQQIHDMGGILLYCDTDSVMYTGLDKCPLPLGDKLGQWDIETYDLVIFRQSKGYLLCNRNWSWYNIEKVACKGVNTENAYEFIIEGMATTFKPMRFKEAQIRIHAAKNKDKFLSEVGVNIWRDVEKQMRSIYIKRKGRRGVTRPVAVNTIPGLERRAFCKATSIRKELKNDKIRIKKPAHKRAFKNIVIPTGWFDKKSKETSTGKERISQKIHWFRSQECMDLHPGDIWFKGIVVRTETGKFSEYYKIHVIFWKAQKTPRPFTGAIKTSFLTNFGITESPLQKTLTVSLAKKYIKNSSLNLNIEISDANFKGQFVDEISGAENETKNLKTLDWSKLDAVHNKIKRAVPGPG